MTEFNEIPLTQSEQNERTLQAMYPDTFLSQEILKTLYEEIKPTWFSRLSDWVTQLSCTHQHYMLVKFKLVRSTQEKDVGTIREYQNIRLALTKQHWACSGCGKMSGLAQPVAKSYKEEHYL